jgi:hypothetical protein
MSVVFSALASTVTEPTVPPTAPPTVPPATQPSVPVDDPSTAAAGKGFAAGMWDVLSGTIENLGDNGYQTGVAVVVTTIAVIAMLNLAVPKWVLAPVGVGAFWAGWLAWNTLSAQDNELFPGNVSATKLWDVALAGDRGFLIVVVVACVAAVFVWKQSTALAGRLMLMLGAVLGASFLYNMFEAVRAA